MLTLSHTLIDAKLAASAAVIGNTVPCLGLVGNVYPVLCVQTPEVILPVSNGT